MARLGKDIDSVDFTGEWSNYRAWFDETIKKHSKEVASDATDLTGALVKFPIADGYAYYVVTKHSPLTLSHLPIGDAYRAHAATIRGFREADVRQQLKQAEFWRSREVVKPH